MSFAEREGLGIVEHKEDFDLKEGLNTRFSFSQKSLRREHKKTTYTAFIDVKKAYDTVWRNGLWKRLWDEGVRGKIWRVIKGMYSVVQSAVLVGDEQTEIFEQGCVMSPVLFSFFINGLAREIKEKTQGVGR